MSMRTVIVVVKTIALCIYAYIYNTVLTAVTPVVANYLALEQMSNSSTASVGLQLFTQLTQNSTVVLLCIALLVYITDIAEIVVKLMQKKDGTINEEK